MCISESVDTISRDEPIVPYLQSIETAVIPHARYTLMHFKHHHQI